MLALRRSHDPSATTPFTSAEGAWLWTMSILMAREDGACLAWRPDGPSRPCDPEDVVRCLDTLYRQRSIDLVHARILRIWGQRQMPPRVRGCSDWRLWHQALGQLEWALRARRVVR